MKDDDVDDDNTAWLSSLFFSVSSLLVAWPYASSLNFLNKYEKKYDLTWLQLLLRYNNEIDIQRYYHTPHSLRTQAYTQ